VSGNEATMAGGIAVTSEGLYWGSLGDGTMRRLAASGGAPAVLAKTGAPRVLAIAGGYATWIGGMGLNGCTVSACQATLKLLSDSGSGAFTSLAYDGHDVYFSGSAGSFSGSVWSCAPPSGCSGAGLTMLGSVAAQGIAVHGPHVLWTDPGNGNQNGNVDVSPTTGGGFTDVASALQLPTGIAADDAYVYWTEADPTAGKVRRCPYTVGYCANPEDLATGLSAPIDLALAGERVYWLDQGDGRVLSCPVTGCAGGPPQVHASGRTGLQHIAVGASCVFWTDGDGGGSVSKAAL
jgi:hypothetical protein